MEQKRGKTLAGKYPPSRPCTCEVCVGYCMRPGWWTVSEAAMAIQGGYAQRMMLEMAPDRSFGVLSPAFKGCEADFARERGAAEGCTFLHDRRCELHGTPFMPLECRHCHHENPSSGKRCHADIEKDWNTPAGRALIVQWSKLTGFWERANLLVLQEQAGGKDR